MTGWNKQKLDPSQDRAETAKMKMRVVSDFSSDLFTVTLSNIVSKIPLQSCVQSKILILLKQILRYIFPLEIEEYRF